jgi:hypothetical protein
VHTKQYEAAVYDLKNLVTGFGRGQGRQGVKRK